MKYITARFFVREPALAARLNAIRALGVSVSIEHIFSTFTGIQVTVTAARGRGSRAINKQIYEILEA